MVRRFVLSIMVGLAFPATQPRAEIIDRILAVVDGQIITMSDARAALRFRLVPEDVSEDPIEAAMQRLINRRLMLNEVERYAPPEPSAADIEAGLAVIRARFKDALAFEIALNQTAMSHEELRRFVRDSRRLATYVRDRFSLPFQPSEADARQYYEDHPAEFSVEGTLRPFEEVADQALARVTEERREPLIREWVDTLRRRGNVSVIYLPARKSAVS